MKNKKERKTIVGFVINHKYFKYTNHPLFNYIFSKIFKNFVGVNLEIIKIYEDESEHLETFVTIFPGDSIRITGGHDKPSTVYVTEDF